MPSAIKITNFYVLIWMDKQWKWRLWAVGRLENGRRAPTTRYFWYYYVACMHRIDIHIHYTLCTREPSIFLSRYKFSHSLCSIFFSVVFNSTLLIWFCAAILYLPNGQAFSMLALLLYLILSHSLPYFHNHFCSISCPC